MRAHRRSTAAHRRRLGRVGGVERVLEDLRRRCLDSREEMRPSGAGARRQVLHRRETPLQGLQHAALPGRRAEFPRGAVRQLRRQRVQGKELHLAAVFRPKWVNFLKRRLVLGISFFFFFIPFSPYNSLYLPQLCVRARAVPRKYSAFIIYPRAKKSRKNRDRTR